MPSSLVCQPVSCANFGPWEILTSPFLAEHGSGVDCLLLHLEIFICMTKVNAFQIRGRLGFNQKPKEQVTGRNRCSTSGRWWPVAGDGQFRLTRTVTLSVARSSKPRKLPHATPLDSDPRYIHTTRPPRPSVLNALVASRTPKVPLYLKGLQCARRSRTIFQKGIYP